MKEQFYVGQIFEDIYPPEAANWCNENQKIMVEIESQNNIRRFQIQEKPEPTIANKKVAVRAVRDQYINDIEWRVSRYRDQVEISVETTDDEETYHKILQYMQYLREYPESSETWYESEPATFEEWKK